MAASRRPTVLLTGATGLLGTWLRRTAPAAVDVVPLTHRTALATDGVQATADLRVREATVTAITRAAPTLVLHAAYALDEPSIVGATRHVAEGAVAADADLILISTDAVFAGDGRVQDEDDWPAPVWDYGRWKVEAERLAQDAPVSTTIVRLPLLVSLDPEDHVTARIHRSAAEDEPAAWFHDELRQPVGVDEAAEAIWRLVALDRAERAGCWHLPGPEVLSRFEIAIRTARALGLDTGRIRPRATPAGTVRPKSLLLGDDRAHRSLGWTPTPIFSRNPQRP